MYMYTHIHGYTYTYIYIHTYAPFMQKVVPFRDREPHLEAPASRERF